MDRREFMGAVAGLSLAATTDGFLSTPLSLKQESDAPGLYTKNDVPSDYCYIIQGWDDLKISPLKFIKQYEEFKSDLVELKTIGINLSRCNWQQRYCNGSGFNIVLSGVFVIYPVSKQTQMAAFRSKYGFETTSHSTCILDKEHKLRILPKNSQPEIWRKVCEFSTKINEFHFENEEEGDTLDLRFTGMKKVTVPEWPGEIFELQSNSNLRQSPLIRRVIVYRNPNSDSVGAGKAGFLVSDRDITYQNQYGDRFARYAR